MPGTRVKPIHDYYTQICRLAGSPAVSRLGTIQARLVRQQDRQGDRGNRFSGLPMAQEGQRTRGRHAPVPADSGPPVPVDRGATDDLDRFIATRRGSPWVSRRCLDESARERPHPAAFWPNPAGTASAAAVTPDRVEPPTPAVARRAAQRGRD